MKCAASIVLFLFLGFTPGTNAQRKNPPAQKTRKFRNFTRKPRPRKPKAISPLPPQHTKSFCR